MKAEELIIKMKLYTQSTLYACELAIAANSAMSHSKLKWTEGPSLHSAANRPTLDETILPLCLKSSRIYNLSQYFLEQDAKQGTAKKYLFNINDLTPAEQIMSTQGILYLFCLLEEYEFSRYRYLAKTKLALIAKGRNFGLKDIKEYGIEGIEDLILNSHMSEYQFSSCRKRVQKWGKLGHRMMSEKLLSEYEKISTRRNELTHSSKAMPSNRAELLTFYLVCRNIVREIAVLLDDNSIDNVNVDWDILEDLEYCWTDEISLLDALES